MGIHTLLTSQSPHLHSAQDAEGSVQGTTSSYPLFSVHLHQLLD